MTEFIEFKKIPRLSRMCVVSEKIDGTNGVIYIGEDGEFLVGSRSRWIGEHTDNHNFWHWTRDNKAELLKLGPGFHYCEWWGSGIQRGYGLPKGEKRFSLFNITLWCLSNEEPKIISVDPKTKEERYQKRLPECCYLVPILWVGIFNTTFIEEQLKLLEKMGSSASPGFMNPEGIVVYHQRGIIFKKTIRGDEQPKSVS